ncbi:methionyl-tRNA formyltransferase, partial [Staphylococcus epidermidis]
MRTIFYPLTKLFIHLSVSRGLPFVIHSADAGDSNPSGYGAGTGVADGVPASEILGEG